MLSSLLRPKKGRRRVEQHSPFSSHYADQSSPIVARHQRRHATADFTETELEDENTEDEEEVDDEDGDQDEQEEQIDAGDDEDGDEDAPLLPLFSAAHLGLY